MLQVVDGELTNNSDSGRVAGCDEGQARVLQAKVFTCHFSLVHPVNYVAVIGAGVIVR